MSNLEFSGYDQVEVTSEDAVKIAGRLSEIEIVLHDLHQEHNRLSAALLNIAFKEDLSNLGDEEYEEVSKMKSKLCNGYGLPERAMPWIRPDALMTDGVDLRKGTVFGEVPDVDPNFFDDITIID